MASGSWPWACCHTIRDVTVVENRHGITGDNDGFETSHCCSAQRQDNAGVGIYLDGRQLRDAQHRA